MSRPNLQSTFATLIVATLIVATGLLSGCQKSSANITISRDQIEFTSSSSGAQFESQTEAPPVMNSEIINGKNANGTEPWYGTVVGIASRSGSKKFSVFCTGSLIDEKTVVTAAHCLVPWEKNLYVIFGLKENAEFIYGRKIKNHAAHEKYKDSTDDDAPDIFDVGLIQFEGGLPRGFKPIPVLEDDSILQHGSEVLVAGYGATNGRKQSGIGQLRYTMVTVKGLSPGKTEIETDESKRGTCHGDSGGPGMIELGGTYYLWGITSRGDDHCKVRGVYTRISQYRDWINHWQTEWKKTLADELE